MEFTIGVPSPFNLDYTLESGQVFRWEKKGEWWYGVLPGGVLKVRQEGETLGCATESDLLGSGFVREYFRLDDDMEGILESIAKDETITHAVQRFYGLRLMKQERWECLASFLLATNANIPRIRGMIASICSKYGAAYRFEGGDYRGFPTAEALAEAKVEDLESCGLGYRAKFLKHMARSVYEGRVDLGEVSFLDYEDSKKLLVKELLGEKVLLGVGPKVADCALLYSFGKDEAFPIDVWIAKVLAKSYPRFFTPAVRKRLSIGTRPKLGRGEYEAVSKAARDYFGPRAGFAQQYLYVWAQSGAE